MDNPLVLSAIAEYEEEKVDSLMGRILIFYFEQARLWTD